MADLSIVKSEPLSGSGGGLRIVKSEPAEEPSALSRFGSGIYKSTIEPIVQVAKSDHPLDAITDTIKQNLGIPELQQIGEAIKAGDYGRASLMIAHHATTSPADRQAQAMIKPVIEDVKSGNLAGAGGRIIGTAGMLALPEAAGVIGKAIEPATSVARAALKAGAAEAVTGRLFTPARAIAGAVGSELGAAVGIPRHIGAAVGAVAPKFIKGAVAGGKAELAAQAARAAARLEEAAAADPLTSRLAEVAARRRIDPGTVIGGPTAPEMLQAEVAAKEAAGAPPAAAAPELPYKPVTAEEVAVGQGGMSAKQFKSLPKDHPARTQAQGIADAINAEQARKAAAPQAPIETPPSVGEQPQPASPVVAPTGSVAPPVEQPASIPQPEATAPVVEPAAGKLTADEISRQLLAEMEKNGHVQPAEQPAVPSVSQPALDAGMQSMPANIRQEMAKANYRAGATGSTDAVPGGQAYEAAGRTNRVDKFAEAIARAKIPLKDARGMNDAEWGVVAKKLGINIPSEATKAQTLSKLSGAAKIGDALMAEGVTAEAADAMTGKHWKTVTKPLGIKGVPDADTIAEVIQHMKLAQRRAKAAAK